MEVYEVIISVFSGIGVLVFGIFLKNSFAKEKVQDDKIDDNNNNIKKVETEQVKIKLNYTEKFSEVQKTAYENKAEVLEVFNDSQKEMTDLINSNQSEMIGLIHQISKK